MARGPAVDPDIKKRALDEYLAGAKASDVAERHSVPVKLLYNWKSNHQVQTAGLKDSSAKVRHLERQLRYKDEEIAVLRDLLKKTYQVMPIDSK
jgi:transposase-like protein